MKSVASSSFTSRKCWSYARSITGTSSLLTGCKGALQRKLRICHKCWILFQIFSKSLKISKALLYVSQYLIKFLSEFNFKHPIHVTIQRLLFVITEWFGLKDFKDHLVQSPCHGQGDVSLDQVFKVLSILTLNTSRDSVSTTCLFHCFTILMEKNFFLVTKQSL